MPVAPVAVILLDLLQVVAEVVLVTMGGVALLI
jgi:hypothetical protein